MPLGVPAKKTTKPFSIKTALKKEIVLPSRNSGRLINNGAKHSIFFEIDSFIGLEEIRIKTMILSDNISLNAGQALKVSCVPGTVVLLSTTTLNCPLILENNPKLAELNTTSRPLLEIPPKFRKDVAEFGSNELLLAITEIELLLNA